MIKRILLAMLIVFSFMAGTALGDTVDVRLAWEHDLPADLAGFRLYSEKSTGPCPANAVSDMPYVEGEPLETTYQVTGSPGEVVYFQVTAYDTSNNESDCSDEVSFTIPDVTPPNKPFNVTIEVIVTP